MEALQRVATLANSLSQPQTHQRAAIPERLSELPHPIAEGSEGKICPVTGLSLFGDDVPEENADMIVAYSALKTDPDIVEERLNPVKAGRAREAMLRTELPRRPLKLVPLNVLGRTHHASADTARLVREIGGLPTLRSFTNLFYQRAFADPHLDRFIRDHDDPHGERFASWIAEKFGAGTPWSDERRTRVPAILRFGRETVEVAYDRSSAHFAAWHSPKREPHKWGQHFRLDDARVWMRVHFWAAREAGMFQFEEFMDYYIKFIGHFVRVYSSKSPIFTRESARWSEDPQNIDRYLAGGNVMSDVIDKPFETSLDDLPVDEQSGSWPYSS